VGVERESAQPQPSGGRNWRGGETRITRNELEKRVEINGVCVCG
jgi:hypothetical protein